MSLDILGAEWEILPVRRRRRPHLYVVGGGFDIKRLRDTLNGVKEATVAQLGVLVDKGIAIEKLSIDTASQFHLPGDATRQNLLEKLVAHRVVLSAAPNQDARVVGAAVATVVQDLMSAAVDLNGTVEGANYNIDHAADLFKDLADSAMDLVKKAVKAGEETMGIATKIAIALAAVFAVVGAAVLYSYRKRLK